MNSDIHNSKSRGDNELHLPSARTSWDKQRFVYSAFNDWNSLDPDVRYSSSSNSFKFSLNGS